ncbi:hypothetical protein HYC85_001700 [Camellia sinensis]|uniref:Protein SCAI n=1 Tax=Camellia sinensis TaxID=4442 RepID=A0A7J7I7E4_CAMSI|nr:hypothetical protein HYC85_001700 [Camellia sinensis]
MADDVVPRTFRALVESADQKFARVRDVPAYGRGPNHYFSKVFKAYMRLWKYQQENRKKLVESGLQRCEIGEIASRIGQLYFNQYMRTSEARFLLESYIFYEAIFNRAYFEGSKGFSKDRGLRFKELRFYARFLLVTLILNRLEMVKLLMERFKALVDDSIATFRVRIQFLKPTSKKWKLVVQEIVRFMKVDTALIYLRPLRYCAKFDSYPASLPYVARFHATKVLKCRDALLTSYHRNEVKFAELTLDTFRMMQCLEWEPSGLFCQKHPVESRENGSPIDHSAISGLIDMNLAADMTDPTLPPNPRKAILYRPSVTQLIAVIATICEELPPDSVMLVYISASGSNSLYGGDIIPFTRRPLFLIIDSDNSHAFKAGLSKLVYNLPHYDDYVAVQLEIGFVLHGAERGETAALLLSPLRPSFKTADVTQNGSQFTLFLTAPLQAFCQLVGLTCSDNDADVYNDADNVLSTSFSEWEVILCTSTMLDLVWAQVLSDPFLRRLILRFIFCRSVLTFFCLREDSDEYLPVCIPQLPNSVSPNSDVVQSAIFRLASHLDVADCFSLK